MDMTNSATGVLDPLPHLTTDIPPVSAAIKRRYEDFMVEEIPAYQPCGDGDHCYFTIEKTGLATMRALHDIAQRLGRPTRDFGIAGLKDARAVTVQTISLEHADPERLAQLDIPRIRVLSVTRHTNKLKIGHLRGNRFRIKLREVDLARVPDVRAVCDVLLRRGVPNFFGQQRFGSRGDTWQIGRGILAGDFVTAMDLMLGRPTPFDSGDVLEARKLYDAGNYAAAARKWPFGSRDNGRACRAMAQSKGNHRRAYNAVDNRLRKLFVNAFQSFLFNRVLAERIQEIDRVRQGDLAYKHDHGAVFLVEDEAIEAPRATAFEISPSGPIFGFKMTPAQGEPGRMEQAILEAEQVNLESFRAIQAMKLPGARRPLRFRPQELEVDGSIDEHGAYIELCFVLPPGCYATTLLREICKQHLAEGLAEEDEP
jgi:tRNA pseudouridine13 synthase